MYAIQAITTKYLAPTNTLGARVKATAESGSITVPWNHALSPCENQHEAACTLARKLGWTDDSGVNIYPPYAFGSLPNGGYAMAFMTR
jgi:hypothetical protein